MALRLGRRAQQSAHHWAARDFGLPQMAHVSEQLTLAKRFGLPFISSVTDRTLIVGRDRTPLESVGDFHTFTADFHAHEGPRIGACPPFGHYWTRGLRVSA